MKIYVNGKDQKMDNDKQRLTILLGAGAAIDLSRDLGQIVSVETITNEVLHSVGNCISIPEDYRCKTCQLLNQIYNDRSHCSTKEHYKPNFEDIFHGLDILQGLKTNKSAYPEYIPMTKTFVDIKDTYTKYSQQGDLSVSLAISHILNVIQNQIESYNIHPVDWYVNFFKKLKDNYYLDIFSLNYDTTLEQVFQNDYNDGFKNETLNGDIECFEFDINEYKNNTETNIISHLHGQIDFRSFVSEENNDLHKIYKLKHPTHQNRKLKDTGDSLITQGGEHISRTSIITGKWKTEKLLQTPFDEYVNYFNNCISNNKNLLIIGYGFSDLYINNALRKFKRKHKDVRKMILIDFMEEKKWNDNYKFDWQKLYSDCTFRAWCDLFDDNFVTGFTKEKYQKVQRNNNYNLYFGGFKNTAKNYSDEIINKFEIKNGIEEIRV